MTPQKGQGISSLPFFFFFFLSSTETGLEKDLRAWTPPSLVARRSSMTSGGGSGFFHLSSMPSGMSLGLMAALGGEEEDEEAAAAEGGPGTGARATGGEVGAEMGLGTPTGTGETR